jgi:hypothetical protein
MQVRGAYGSITNVRPGTKVHPAFEMENRDIENNILMGINPFYY